jgi:DNA-directed RNA polymerase specialized sigma24 family protein
MSSSIRRVFDSQDILATVARRLDEMVCSGQLKATNEFQLMGLLMKMASHAVVDKARIVERLRSVEAEDQIVARSFEHAFRELEPDSPDGSRVIERAFNATTDAVDRTILSLWLNGFDHGAIASVTRLSTEAVRFRWHRLRGRLREAIAPMLEDAA